MKKISLLLVATAFAFAVSAKSGSQTQTQQDPKTCSACNPHVCTAACKATGKLVHVYVHGEKGHVCTDACAKLATPK